MQHTKFDAHRAASLRKQINVLAAEYREAEQTESKAELRCRKAAIIALERQTVEC